MIEDITEYISITVDNIDKINKILLDEINFASEHYASLELGRTDMYNILDIVNKILGDNK